MMRLISLLIISMISTSVIAADGEFSVAKINPSLFKNANVIKRSDIITYEVISTTKAKYYHKYALTILNESGDRYANLVEYYDKLRAIKSINGTLYDNKGKEIKSLKSKEIVDLSAVSGMNLMDDSRVKAFSFNYKSYPYTVEFEITYEFNNTYLFPKWLPQIAEAVAVEKAEISVIIPSWYKFRYKAFNYTKGEPDIKNINSSTIYFWNIENVSAIHKEYACPEWTSLTTSVFFSPEKFEIGKYSGNMTSWNELGKFQIELNKGRDILPETVKRKVHELTDGVDNEKEKVKLLYEYLQKNTRYISIQLGIGGLQPFEAAIVASKAYGDCKALSNYMYALLKEANITSLYTQIRAGRGEYYFIPEFTYDPFNHIILLVPLQKDTLWLECTSQTIAAGYLGSHTNNRYALAINDKEGVLVHTPSYGINENTSTKNIKAKVDESGNMELVSRATYSALLQDDIHHMINLLSKEKVKEYLSEKLDFASYDINSFKYNETKSELPVINEQLSISVSNYATVSGRRLFIVPNVMTMSYRNLSKEEERKYDIIFNYAYREIDSIEIEIPNGYKIESNLSDVFLKSQFGNYTLSIKVDDNKIICYRLLEHFEGHYPASAYNDMVAYFDKIYKADRAKLVFVKSETTKGF